MKQIPRLAALARNDSVTFRMAVVAVMVIVWAIRTMLGILAEVLAWGAVVAAG